MDCAYQEGEEDMMDLAMFHESSDKDEEYFDLVIGHIEDIVMDENFHFLQSQVLEKHYKEFDESEENKFIYTDIHKEYINLLENYIEGQLARRVNNFSMSAFTAQLVKNQKDLDGEIFDLLMTFSSFMAFKETILDYKMAKEGRTVDLSAGLTVTPLVLR